MMGKLQIMDSSGDKTVRWRKDRPDEVRRAKEQFDEHIGKGYLAYRQGKNGEDGELLRRFDKNAERIILAPPISGG